MDDITILNEAKEYIKNNLTMADTAQLFGISKRTLQLHFLKLQKIDDSLYKAVKEKQYIVQIKGRVKGGQLGKRTTTWTKEKANEVADLLISGGYTYEDLSKLLKIPKSTIYEMVHSSFISQDKKYRIEAVALINRNDRKYK